MTKEGRFEELARLLPERDSAGSFFWQPFVGRIVERLDGLPAPDGSESFVEACVAAGCQAVAAMRRSSLWESKAPPASDPTARGIFELRIRLSMFFAGCLRAVVHGLCRLRVETDGAEWHAGLGGLKAGDQEWHPVTGDDMSFRQVLEKLGGKPPEVKWSDAVPAVGDVGVLGGAYFPFQEVLLVSPALASEVLAFIQPGRPRGLFGRMLGRERGTDGEPVDVGGVFLEALVQAVEQKALRINTRADGHLFATPAFWLLTAPIGLDCVKDLLRTRRKDPRYNIPRSEIFRALQTGGHLSGAGAAESRNAVRVYEVDVEGWSEPLELYGLAIAVESLPAQAGVVPPFEGTVTFKREITDGRHGPYGRPMERDRDGHGGGADLFVVRREAHFGRGLLSERGYNDSYLLFRPSSLFKLEVGDGVLRLNEALSGFRGRIVEDMLALGQEGLKGHYAELNRRVEVVRDRLLNVIKCCQKGFDGLFTEVLDAEGAQEQGQFEQEQAGTEPGVSQVFEAVRKRNVQEGILTDLGYERGYVAFRPCPFYGRVVGEIVYTLNDALQRMEGRLPYYVAGGGEELVLRYSGRLRKDMGALRAELEDVVEYCGKNAA